MISEPQNVSLKISDSTREHLKSFFEGIVTDQKLAALVGALDDAVVEIEPLGEGFISTSKHMYLHEQIRIAGSGKRGEEDDFGLFLTNEFFHLAGDAPYGLGLLSFFRQVIAARELGFTFIRTCAEGSIDDPDGFVGYYVWARFGFNASLGKDEVEALPKEFQGCEDLNDLMLGGGQEWWRQNGSGRDMIFLLSEEELSLTVLRNYLIEKGVETKL